MKEITVFDQTKRELEAQGVQPQAWVLAQLRAAGFDLDRPIHYRYHHGLAYTRIYQYEYTPEDRSNPDYDADFLDEEAWDRACELLVADAEAYHEALASGTKRNPS